MAFPRQLLQLEKINQTRIPFAVKSSRYTTNPGFSLTKGVHISIARFRKTVIHEGSGTVDDGPGLSWIDVYEYLTPRDLNVAGGRSNGVGVADLTVGGGELTNQQTSTGSPPRTVLRLSSM